MVSAGAQLILDELAARGYTPDTLSSHVAIQINDTHPSMVIPELIRLLTERGLTFDQAVEQVEKTCAYTNHTILAEALEKWPLDYIQTVAPQIVPIIRELDQRARQRSGDGRVAILDDGGPGAHGPHGHPLRPLGERPWPPSTPRSSRAAS